MRVVLLTHVFPRAADDPLGAFLLHLARSLNRAAVEQGHGAQVSVIAPHAAGLEESETLETIPVTRFRYASDDQETLAYTGVMHQHVARSWSGKLLFARFLVAYFRAALRAARRQKANVLHAHWWLPGGLVGALVSKLTHTPLVITMHGTDVEQLRRARRAQFLARFSFGQARVITCGSTYLRDQLLELGVAHEKRVRVIPMPVNPLFVNASQINGRIESANERSLTFTILTVARLTAQKGIDVLIDALGMLRARNIPARLQIAGDGAERRALEEKTRALNLQSFVEFLGMIQQEQLPALYGACSAFVLPSVREGMGLVLAEALLCGAPVISTRSGGVTDNVRDGETGLLFPERDAPALADALERYWREPQYAARLAQQGRAWVYDHFAPERVAEQFLQAYETALR